MDKDSGYLYWLKSMSRNVFVTWGNDWQGTGDAVYEAVGAIAWSVKATLFRASVILTFPVSMPLIALYLLSAERKTIQRKKEQKEALFKLCQRASK